jgi:hypothetical protein
LLHPKFKKYNLKIIKFIKMGCCEARNGSDRYDMNVRNQYNTSFQNPNNKDIIRIGTRPDIDYSKHLNLKKVKNNY